MTKRPMSCVVLVIFAGNLGTSLPVLGQSILLFVLVFFIVLMFLCCKQVRKRGKGVALLFFFVLGYLVARREQSFTIHEKYIEANQVILVEGKLYKRELKNETYLFYLKNAVFTAKSKNYSCNRAIVYLSAEALFIPPIGSEITLKGNYTNFKMPRNKGNFDEKKYYFNQSIFGKLKNAVLIKSSGSYHVYQEYLQKMRSALKIIYTKITTKETASLLITMLLGDKSSLEGELKSLYQMAGISHILAISGLHISIVGALCYKGLRKIGCSFFLGGLLGIFTIVSFGIMVGLSTSTFRAVFMFCMYIVAQIIGRTYDMLTGLSVAGSLLLLQYPSIWQDIGFQLSFGAILGITFVMPWLQILWPTKSKLMQGILASLAIQLTTFPIMAMGFYENTLYSIFLNGLVLPLVGIVIICGILGGIVGSVSYLVGSWCVIPCVYIFKLYEFLCEKFTSMPYANYIVGQPKLWKVLVYFLIFGMIIFLFNKKKMKWIVGVGLCALLFWFSNESYKGLEITILDVGQGDGIFIRNGNESTYFIDGGSTDIKKLGTYVLLPFLKASGVGAIDYWFVSHPDQDHISGLLELFESNYKIRNLVLPGLTMIDEKYENLVEQAKRAGCNIIYMKALDTFREGDLKIRCLHPTSDFLSKSTNDYSLTLEIEYEKFRGLFTGDLEGAGESVVEKSKMLKQCTLLKVAHHGSKNSTFPKFLEQIKPEISIISVGEKNGYGHPNEELLERLALQNNLVYCTKTKGSFTILINENQISTFAFMK